MVTMAVATKMRFLCRPVASVKQSVYRTKLVAPWEYFIDQFVPECLLRSTVYANPIFDLREHAIQRMGGVWNLEVLMRLIVKRRGQWVMSER